MEAEVKSLGFTTQKVDDSNLLNNDLLVKKTSLFLRKTGLDPEETSTISDFNKSFQSSIVPGIRKDISYKLSTFNSANSILSTADDAINSISEDLSTIKSEIESFNSNYNSDNTQNLSDKAKSLLENIQNVVNKANFEGQKILNGDFTATYLVNNEDINNQLAKIEIDFSINNKKISQENEFSLNPNLPEKSIADISLEASEKIEEEMVKNEKSTKLADKLKRLSEKNRLRADKEVNEPNENSDNKKSDKVDKSAVEDKSNTSKTEKNKSINDIINSIAKKALALKQENLTNSSSVKDKGSSNATQLKNGKQVNTDNVSKNKNNNSNQLASVNNNQTAANKTNLANNIKKIKKASDPYYEELKITISDAIKNQFENITKNTDLRISKFLENKKEKQTALDNQPIISLAKRSLSSKFDVNNKNYAGVKGLDLKDLTLASSTNPGVFSQTVISLTLQSINSALENINNFSKYIQEIKMQVSNLENTSVKSLSINNSLFPKVENIDFANRYLDSLKDKLKLQTSIVSLAQANETPNSFVNFLNKNDFNVSLTSKKSTSIVDKNDVNTSISSSINSFNNASTTSSSANSKLSIYEEN